MTLEQRVAVLEEIFLKLRDYYMSTYSGEEIDALLASAGVPIGITKEYDSVSAMNSDFSGTDVTRGQFVLILPSDTVNFFPLSLISGGSTSMPISLQFLMYFDI